MDVSTISTYEQEVNRTVARIMRITSMFMVLTFVLNVLKIFAIPVRIMGITTVVICGGLWIPTWITNVRKW